MLYKKKERMYYSTTTQSIFQVLNSAYITSWWLLRPQLTVLKAALQALVAVSELSINLQQ